MGNQQAAAAQPQGHAAGERVNAPTEADVLTAHGFRLLARADEARPAYRLGLVAAALFAFTEADYGYPETADELGAAIWGGGDSGGNQTDQ